jgi:hypothetical protein
VRLARLEDHRFARPGELCRLSRPLITETLLLYRQALFLEVVDVHGRTSARLDEVLAFEALAAAGAGYPPQEGEALAGAVLDGVRVSKRFHARR